MNDSTLNLLLHVQAFAWALAAGTATVYLLRAGSQIRYVTLADGRRQERRLPLLFRFLLPLVPNLEFIVRNPAFDRQREEVESRLIAAGYEGLIGAEEFFGLRILLGILGLVAGASTAQPVLATAGLLLGMLYPSWWLRKALAARHRSIQKALPFVLDLLTISVEAGVDFMTGLRKILDRRALDPLGEEIFRVFHEIQLGKTRREALREMGRRVRQPDLLSVTNALAQADELGVSLGAILRIQADQLRVKRFLRAEQLAQEAPVKLLGPLVLFIFPAVLIILLAPILLRGFGFGF